MFLKSQKKNLVLLGVIFSLLFLMIGCSGEDVFKVEDNIVLKIEDQEFTRDDLQKFIALNDMFHLMYEGRELYIGDHAEKTKEEYLDLFSQRKLTVFIAKDEEIVIDYNFLKGEMDNLIASFILSLGEDNYKQIREKHQLTKEEFEESLQQYIFENHYQDGLFKSLHSDVAITDEQAKNYYDENPVRYSLTTVTAKTILINNKELAQEISSKAKRGKNFDDLIKEYQEKDGVLGIFEPIPFEYHYLPPEFSQVAFSLKVGEVSEPVKTSRGYDVIYVEQRQEGPMLNFDDIKDSIKRELAFSYRNDMYEDFIDEKIKEITLKTYKENL